MIEPGTLVAARYRLDERVAIESHGEAWRAADIVLGRGVTVWCQLKPFGGAEGFEQRLWPNVRAVATVTHPRLVHIIDYGSDPSAGPYVITENPDAQSLSQILASEGRLTPQRTSSILAGVAEGLQALHNAGFVHCHVTPATILVRPDGTGLLSGLFLSSLGRDAVPTGPTTYLTPEQAMGQSVSVSSDIYALGLVGYVCLAGRPPFEHKDRLYVALMHVRDTPPPIDGPPAVAATVMRAMAKNPSDRWPSAAAFAEALSGAAEPERLPPIGGLPAASTYSPMPDPERAVPQPSGAQHEFSEPTGALPSLPSSGTFPDPTAVDSWGPPSGATPASGSPPGGVLGGQDRVRILPGSSGRGRRGGLWWPNWLRRSTPASAPAPGGERLSFTAAYPSAVGVGEWHAFVCVVAKAGLRQRVDEILQRWEPELGDAAQSSTTGVAPVTRGTRLSLVPSVPGLVFNPERLDVAWHEDVHEVVFRMGTAPGVRPGITSGHLEVHAGTLLLAVVPVSVHVTADHGPARQRPLTTTAHAAALDRVFASYSRRDADVVDACVGFYRALGVEVLMDRIDLRGGDDWRAALHDLIERSDIFQLYWSTAAAGSPEVENEWRYALRLTRPGSRFIRPVFWEHPMPEAPADLGHLHFSRIDLDQIRAHPSG